MQRISGRTERTFGCVFLVCLQGKGPEQGALLLHHRIAVQTKTTQLLHERGVRHGAGQRTDLDTIEGLSTDIAWHHDHIHDPRRLQPGLFGLGVGFQREGAGLHVAL